MDRIHSPLIVALDFPTAAQAREISDQLDPAKCKVKVGKELFTREGPALVKALVESGFDVFLDLKFHDIPNTVAKAVIAGAELGVWMLNIHVSGGRQMMTAAREALDGLKFDTPPLLIGVTVLTSTSQAEMTDLGVSRALPAQVDHLADMAQSCGLDGVVCSAHEAGVIKRTLGQEFQTVTPGIRPEGSDVGDQHRIMTPEQAVASGSDYLVVGRPITQAENPMAVVTDILDRLNI